MGMLRALRLLLVLGLLGLVPLRLERRRSRYRCTWSMMLFKVAVIRGLLVFVLMGALVVLALVLYLHVLLGLLLSVGLI